MNIVTEPGVAAVVIVSGVFLGMAGMVVEIASSPFVPGIGVGDAAACELIASFAAAPRAPWMGG